MRPGARVSDVSSLGTPSQRTCDVEAAEADNGSRRHSEKRRRHPRVAGLVARGSAAGFLSQEDEPPTGEEKDARASEVPVVGAEEAPETQAAEADREQQQRQSQARRRQARGQG